MNAGSRYINAFAIFLLGLLACQNDPASKPEVNCSSFERDEKFISEKNLDVALLASRFKDLEEFQKVVELRFYKSGEEVAPGMGADQVVLRYCSRGDMITATLKDGVSQKDIMKARDGGISEKLSLLFSSSYAVAHRKELKEIHLLSRRRHDLYGWGDEAFFDLAEYASERLIRRPEKACVNELDCGEKGYLNTFNHITAQALITSLYSEELADYIADVHELYNMPELVNGKFTNEQLSNPDNYPLDNYVDLINNEIGQELGKEISKKLNINRQTIWDEALLTNYLNYLQSFYSVAFQIGMKPFEKEDILIRNFTQKINLVRKNTTAS